MKTYLKGMKTVAVIFLSLMLFSCQDEQIELQDTLSTASDELMLNRGKPPKDDNTGRNDFTVSLTNPQNLFPNALVSVPGCDGTFNSKQTLFWFDDDCDPLYVTISGVFGELYLHAIRPATGSNGGDGRYSLSMKGFVDTSNQDVDYRAWFEGPVMDFSNNEIQPYHINDNEIELYSEWTRVRIGKDWVNIPIEEGRTGIIITIGTITIAPAL